MAGQPPGWHALAPDEIPAEKQRVLGIMGATLVGFFGSLKAEWIDTGYATEAQARTEVFKCIEMFYNPIRRRSALGYLSPVEYEQCYEAGELIPMDEAA